MARKCIEKYLETHKSTYIGKYRCHSAVQTKKFEHKFHYYILDIQFKAIDVFVTIDYSGYEIVPTFSVNLNEQEQEYLHMHRYIVHDYNTFLFVCFPISTFPPEYKEIMRLELEKAIRFYAARMNHDEYRLTSFEQVANINRLLMEEYKEEYSDGKE